MKNNATIRASHVQDAVEINNAHGDVVLRTPYVEVVVAYKTGDHLAVLRDLEFAVARVIEQINDAIGQTDEAADEAGAE